ncbi:MAG: iron-containing alcohol dehydrogenase [Armatimonadota bacterium]
MQTFIFQAPTQITFGSGALAQLPEAIAELGERVLAVSDPGVAAAGILDQVAARVRDSGRRTELVTDVEPNPSIETVERTADVYRRAGCQWVLAVGGGSAMDVGKAVALLAAHPGPLRAYEGIGKVPGPVAPLVCVPTTAGTGSEVTVFSVITDRRRKFKMTVGSPHLLPRFAVCDPDLTVSMPQPLTAATGMDALTHAIECYTNTVYHPIAKTLALEAVRLIGTSLRAAYADGRDLDARAQMLLASTLAAMAFTRTRLGNVHAMSHPVGAHFDVPHGVANALLLPYIMEWNLPGCLDTFPRIAEALGERVDGRLPGAAAAAAVDAVRRLGRDLGIPERLRDVGVTQDGLPPMARDAMLSGNVTVNPRATTAAEMLELFEQAW